MISFVTELGVGKFTFKIFINKDLYGSSNQLIVTCVVSNVNKFLVMLKDGFMCTFIVKPNAS